MSPRLVTPRGVASPAASAIPGRAIASAARRPLRARVPPSRRAPRPPGLPGGMPRPETYDGVIGKSLVPAKFHVPPGATGRMNRRPAARGWRTPREAAALSRCAPRPAPPRPQSVQNRRASAGILDAAAKGTCQACVARGRRELLAPAPTPLLRRSPLELVKEPIALAHAAPYRPPARCTSVCASAETTRSRQQAASLPSDLAQAFSVIVGSHLYEDARLVIVCGRDRSGG